MYEYKKGIMFHTLNFNNTSVKFIQQLLFSNNSIKVNKEK